MHPREPSANQIVHRASGQKDRMRAMGPYAIESLIEEDEEGEGTVYRVRIEPHQRTAVSYHRVAEEYYYILSGRGTAVFNGREVRLAAGEFVRLPPGTTHSFATGEESLEMLNIHTPGCRPHRDTYFVGPDVPEGFSRG